MFIFRHFFHYPATEKSSSPKFPRKCRQALAKERGWLCYDIAPSSLKSSQQLGRLQLRDTALQRAEGARQAFVSQQWKREWANFEEGPVPCSWTSPREGDCNYAFETCSRPKQVQAAPSWSSSQRGNRRRWRERAPQMGATEGACCGQSRGGQLAARPQPEPQWLPQRPTSLREY